MARGVINKTSGGSHQWYSGCWYWLGIRCWESRCWRLFWGGRRRGGTRTAAANLRRNHRNKHWPPKSSTQLRCHLCSSCGQRKGTVYKCARCDVGLCMVPCFAEYHTRV